MMMSISLFTSAWNWNCSPPLAGASSDLMPTGRSAHGLAGWVAAATEAACCSSAAAGAQSAARARASFIIWVGASTGTGSGPSAVAYALAAWTRVKGEGCYRR